MAFLVCKCGADDFFYYEGVLGYEARVCRRCGRYWDYSGEHAPDEYSRQWARGRDAKPVEVMVVTHVFLQWTCPACAKKNKENDLHPLALRCPKCGGKFKEGARLCL